MRVDLPLLLLACMLVLTATTCVASAMSLAPWEQINDNVFVQVCAESIVRVVALPPGAPSAPPTSPSLVVREDWDLVNYTVVHTPSTVIITTSKIKVSKL